MLIQLLLLIWGTQNIGLCAHRDFFERAHYVLASAYGALESDNTTEEFIIVGSLESNCGQQLKSFSSSACGPWHLLPKYFGPCFSSWFKEAIRAGKAIDDFKNSCGNKYWYQCYRKGTGVCKRGGFGLKNEMLCHSAQNGYNLHKNQLFRGMEKIKKKVDYYYPKYYVLRDIAPFRN